MQAITHLTTPGNRGVGSRRSQDLLRLGEVGAGVVGSTGDGTRLAGARAALTEEAMEGEDEKVVDGTLVVERGRREEGRVVRKGGMKRELRPEEKKAVVVRAMERGVQQLQRHVWETMGQVSARSCIVR